MALETKWPVLRDVLSFGVGAYGLVNEFQQATRDPITMAFCAGLMGVPAILGVKRNGHTHPAPSSEGSS